MGVTGNPGWKKLSYKLSFHNLAATQKGIVQVCTEPSYRVDTCTRQLTELQVHYLRDRKIQFEINRVYYVKISNFIGLLLIAVALL